MADAIEVRAAATSELARAIDTITRAFAADPFTRARAFEVPVVTVSEAGPDGRVQRLYLYDIEQLDEARACFAALRMPASTSASSASDPGSGTTSTRRSS